MFNGDPSLPMLTTEQIQKCLEENKELILAILECQRQGKFTETLHFQARLQHNLTYLAKLADAAPQGKTPPQVVKGQGMEHPHVSMSQQQPDVSIHQQHHLPLEVNDQQYQHQQQQQQMAMSMQHPDLSASKLPFQMNEQHHHKMPGFYQQHQLFPAPMGGFAGYNSGMFQSPPQARLNNLSDTTTPLSNQYGSDVSPGWSLGM